MNNRYISNETNDPQFRKILWVFIKKLKIFWKKFCRWKN